MKHMLVLDTAELGGAGCVSARNRLGILGMNDYLEWIAYEALETQWGSQKRRLDKE